MTGFHPTGVGRVFTRENPQQGGLTGTIQAEDHHSGTPIDRQVDIGEYLQRAVVLAQFGCGQWHPAAGGWLGQPQPSDPISLPDFDAIHEPICSSQHHLRGSCLSRLSPHPFRLIPQCGGLPFRVGLFSPPAPFVQFPLLQIPLPTGVVDVENTSGGIEVEHSVDRGRQQFNIVTDDHHRALKPR